MKKTINSMLIILEGLRLLTKPGIRQFVIMPLLINIVLFISLFWLSEHYFHLFQTWVSHYLPHWLTWLAAILWLFFFVAFFIVFIYTFTTLANIVGAPFNSFLAEKVELVLTGTTPSSRSLGDNIRDIPRIIGRQLLIVGYYLPRALGLLLLFFIPIIQLAAPFLWFLFNAWFMTLQYLDYPADNQHVSLQTMRQRIKAKSGIAMGFGVGTLIFSMIPGLNFIAVPAAVAGATKLWIEQYKDT